MYGRARPAARRAKLFNAVTRHAHRMLHRGPLFCGPLAARASAKAWSTRTAGFKRSVLVAPPIEHDVDDGWRSGPTVIELTVRLNDLLRIEDAATQQSHLSSAPLVFADLLADSIRRLSSAARVPAMRIGFSTHASDHVAFTLILGSAISWDALRAGLKPSRELGYDVVSLAAS